MNVNALGGMLQDRGAVSQGLLLQGLEDAGEFVKTTTVCIADKIATGILIATMALSTISASDAPCVNLCVIEQSLSCVQSSDSAVTCVKTRDEAVADLQAGEDC